MPLFLSFLAVPGVRCFLHKTPSALYGLFLFLEVSWFVTLTLLQLHRAGLCCFLHATPRASLLTRPSQSLRLSSSCHAYGGTHAILVDACPHQKQKQPHRTSRLTNIDTHPISQAPSSTHHVHHSPPHSRTTK